MSFLFFYSNALTEVFWNKLIFIPAELFQIFGRWRFIYVLLTHLYGEIEVVVCKSRPVNLLPLSRTKALFCGSTVLGSEGSVVVVRNAFKELWSVLGESSWNITIFVDKHVHNSFIFWLTIRVLNLWSANVLRSQLGWDFLMSFMAHWLMDWFLNGLDLWH